jgi:hypothetical protein
MHTELVGRDGRSLGGLMAWAAGANYGFIGAIVYLLVSWFAIFAERVVTKTQHRKTKADQR